MLKKANFHVEGRLTQLLGENYSSVEHAIKELVDNAWDAEAKNISVVLPKSLDEKERFITITDDGTGMSAEDIETEYLHIARDRISIKGIYSDVLKRKIKGRKGIGKFAGLLVADTMKVTTRKNGQQIIFVIDKNQLANSHDNLTSTDINMQVTNCNNAISGTEIRLENLDILSLTPHDYKLRQLLTLEYEREDDFNIVINDMPILVEDIGGKNYTYENSDKSIFLNFNIALKEITKKQAGIVLRVNGKIIGKPHYWGVEDENYIHHKLLKRLYGEVNADFLESITTNSWGIMESSLQYAKVCEFVKDNLLIALNDSFEEQINAQKKHLQSEINKQIEKLPEHKREKAIKIIDKMLKGLSDGRHSNQQIKNILSVAISAIENDDYYEIIEKLAETNNDDIALFAQILEEFGLIDISTTINQAIARRKILDKLQILVDNPKTLEAEIHTALEKNMWVFGKSYSLMSSNQTTKHIVKKYLDEQFKGRRANKRPDLLLNQDNTDRLLLIEFKRPITINRDHESQAAKYRDDLLTKFTNKAIHIIVLGKSVDSTISSNNTQPNCQLTSYDFLIADARNELEWLISNLQR